MTQKIDEQTRKQVIAFLPDALNKTLQSYRLFSAGEIADNAKEFSAHHSACKVAIAHLQLLIKLAEWAEVSGEDAATLEDIKGKLSKAQEELDESCSQDPNIMNV